MTREPVTLEIRLQNVAFHIQSYPSPTAEINQVSDLQWIEENLSESSNSPTKSQATELSLPAPGGGVVALHRDPAIYQTLYRQRELYTQPVQCFSMHGSNVSTLKKPSDSQFIYDSDLQVFYQISKKQRAVSRSNSNPSLSLSEDSVPTVIVFANDKQHSARIAILRIVRELASQRMISLGWLPLHASAVATSHGSILVLGERRAGKSTLMLQLLTESSCDFLANDRVCIDVCAPNGPQTYSIPCVINLRASSLDLLSTHSTTSDIPHRLCNPICRTWRARETLEETFSKPHPIRDDIPPTDLTLSPSQFLHLIQRKKVSNAVAGVLLFPSIRDVKGVSIRRLTPDECLSNLRSNLFPITPSVFLNSCCTDSTTQEDSTQVANFELPLARLANCVCAYAIEIERGRLLSKEVLSSLVMSSLD